MIDLRLLACAFGSLIFHFALERGLEQLPPLASEPPPTPIEVTVIEPQKEPPPEPPKPEEPKPEEPKPVPHEIPHAKPVHTPTVSPVAKDAPPTDKPAYQTDPDEVFQGGNLTSASTVGNGPEVQVGNTTQAAPGPATHVKAAAAPIAAAEATKLPMPQGRCFGKYTDDARAAGLEGTVVLDLIVGEDGHVREISVSQGLAHGLTEAAIAALKECRFTPGERDGKPVPVRVRGFKIHFVLDSGS